MSKYHLMGGIFAALLLGACAHQDGRQNNDAQASRDLAHCQAVALAEAPPLMWVTTPARIIPETRECTQQLRNVLCANRPGYTIPAIEEDANLQPREQALNACLTALRTIPAAKQPSLAAAAALPARPARQRAPADAGDSDNDSEPNSAAPLAAASGQQAKDAANAAPGEWIKDCEQCPQMVRIAPGSFKMGSTDSADEQPVHRVNLPGFYMGRYEVTQQEWRQLMGTNPSANKACGARCPVDRISWHDAQAFVKKLSEHTGKPYRLPTEAEWEYAARAGSRTAWSFGPDERELKQHAWFNGNSGGAVHPVGLKQANPFGLHDMHGNVWEWVEDAFHGSYGNGNGSADNSTARVLRGGSWYNNPRDLRASKRNPNAADEGYVFFGLRVVRSL